uniref:Uncharacterized protein n=1 Tax=Chromera velia CCMP2878 TaxID=1169474 RepID=A0A0G4I4L7_9ALVE|eukprot:Cvel_10930.t1-p1 / transcript=Cvel_10930.t1 / gene=Cvel_10930 / organism=Chromera_velia_CCMP2878 / gene_product=hypothetical protein / transcript_product=hypothetical protein / location=Cvel_scaffold672:12881-23480(-) / protein_length=1601 / sequence_SO=supercontig / SO=protein_coding / is_pseudo=false
MITYTCLRWPKGHRSIKTHPEQVYQRKAAGEGSGGSGEAAILERVYGPHPNTGDFFSDTFIALIPPSVAREEPERGLLPAVFNRDRMAKKRLTPMYLSSTSFDLNLMQSALGKVCLGFWPSTKLPEEEDTPEAQQALKELHNEMTTFLFSDLARAESEGHSFSFLEPRGAIMDEQRRGEVGQRDVVLHTPLQLLALDEPKANKMMQQFDKTTCLAKSTQRTFTPFLQKGPADEREQKVKLIAEEIEAKCQRGRHQRRKDGYVAWPSLRTTMADRLSPRIPQALESPRPTQRTPRGGGGGIPMASQVKGVLVEIWGFVKRIAWSIYCSTRNGYFLHISFANFQQSVLALPLVIVLLFAVGLISNPSTVCCLVLISAEISFFALESGWRSGNEGDSGGSGGGQAQSGHFGVPGASSSFWLAAVPVLAIYACVVCLFIPDMLTVCLCLLPFALIGREILYGRENNAEWGGTYGAGVLDKQSFGPHGFAVRLRLLVAIVHGAVATLLLMFGYALVGTVVDRKRSPVLFGQREFPWALVLLLPALRLFFRFAAPVLLSWAILAVPVPPPLPEIVRLELTKAQGAVEGGEPEGWDGDREDLKIRQAEGKLKSKRHLTKGERESRSQQKQQQQQKQMLTATDRRGEGGDGTPPEGRLPTASADTAAGGLGSSPLSQLQPPPSAGAGAGGGGASAKSVSQAGGTDRDTPTEGEALRGLGGGSLASLASIVPPSPLVGMSGSSDGEKGAEASPFSVGAAGERRRSRVLEKDKEKEKDGGKERRRGKDKDGYSKSMQADGGVQGDRQRDRDRDRDREKCAMQVEERVVFQAPPLPSRPLDSMILFVDFLSLVFFWVEVPIGLALLLLEGGTPFLLAALLLTLSDALTPCVLHASPFLGTRGLSRLLDKLSQGQQTGLGGLQDFSLSSEEKEVSSAASGQIPSFVLERRQRPPFLSDLRKDGSAAGQPAWQPHEFLLADDLPLYKYPHVKRRFLLLPRRMASISLDASTLSYAQSGVKSGDGGMVSGVISHPLQRRAASVPFHLVALALGWLDPQGSHTPFVPPLLFDSREKRFFKKKKRAAMSLQKPQHRQPLFPAFPTARVKSLLSAHQPGVTAALPKTSRAPPTRKASPKLQDPHAISPSPRTQHGEVPPPSPSVLVSPPVGEEEEREKEREAGPQDPKREKEVQRVQRGPNTWLSLQHHCAAVKGGLPPVPSLFSAAAREREREGFVSRPPSAGGKNLPSDFLQGNMVVSTASPGGGLGSSERAWGDGRVEIYRGLLLDLFRSVRVQRAFVSDERKKGECATDLPFFDFYMDSLGFPVPQVEEEEKGKDEKESGKGVDAVIHPVVENGKEVVGAHPEVGGGKGGEGGDEVPFAPLCSWSWSDTESRGGDLQRRHAPVRTSLPGRLLVRESEDLAGGGMGMEVGEEEGGDLEVGDRGVGQKNLEGDPARGAVFLPLFGRISEAEFRRETIQKGADLDRQRRVVALEAAVATGAVARKLAIETALLAAMCGPLAAGCLMVMLDVWPTGGVGLASWEPLNLWVLVFFRVLFLLFLRVVGDCLASVVEDILAGPSVRWGAKWLWLEHTRPSVVILRAVLPAAAVAIVCIRFV